MCIFDSSNAKPETPIMDILYWSRFRMRVIGRCVYCASDASLGNFHESSIASHSPHVSARYRHWSFYKHLMILWLSSVMNYGLYVNDLRRPLDIMVKGLATFTVTFYGIFHSTCHNLMLKRSQFWRYRCVIWSCKRCFGKQERPQWQICIRDQICSNCRDGAFFIARVCKWPIWSRYICHKDVINIS